MRGAFFAAIGIGMAASAGLAGDATEVEKERAKFQGTWQLVSAETDGAKTPDDFVAKVRVIISGASHSVRIGDEVVAHDVAFDIDPTTVPKSTTDTIPDGPDKGKKIRGIYRLEGDTLTSCVGPVDGPRPSEFTAKEGSKQTLRVFHRVKDAAPKDEAARAEFKRFEGTWAFVSMEINGKAVPVANLKDSRLIFKDERFTSKGEDTNEGTFAVDPAAKPKTIDIKVSVGEGKTITILGIYKFEGDSYTICSALPGKPRPTEFSARAGGGQGLTVMKRETP